MALGTTGTVVTAAAVAGLAGAGAVLVVGGAPGSAPPPSPDAVHRVTELEERISKQENELRTLRARLEEAESTRRTAGSGPAVPAMVVESREVPVVDPATLPEGYENLPPEERERLQKAFQEMRAKEQEEARATRLKAQDARLRARLDRLPAELGLTPELKDSVARIYAERGEKMRALFEEGRAAGNADAIRTVQERAQALRQESHQALQQILTPEQLKAVEQVSDRGLPAAGGRFGARGGAGRGTGAPR